MGSFFGGIWMERRKRARGGKALRLVAAAALAVAMSGGPSAAASLHDELVGLLETHPRIQSAVENVLAAEQSIKESNAAFFPTVDVSGDVGYEIVDSPGTRSGFGGATEEDRNSLRLNVDLNVFDGFRKYANKNRTTLEKAAAEDALEATRQQITFQGVGAYLDVLRQIRLIEFARLTEQTIQRQLNLEDERVRRGSGLAVDVLQAKSRLQIAKQIRVGIEGRLRTAQSRYLQVFGHAPELGALENPTPPLDAIPTSLEEAEALARDINPQLSESSRQIDIADEVKRASQADFYPRLNLVLEGNREDDVDGIIGLRRDVSVQLRATWELFSGFARQARVARAAHQRAASKNNYLYVDRQVTDEVRIAWYQLETARERRDLLENAINIAGEVFDARRRLRDAGKETVINVLDAENEFNNARLQYTDAFYEAMLAVYQLYRAMGRLTPEVLGLPTQ